jgi:DNA-binding MarR family transcriptional regulator
MPLDLYGLNPYEFRIYGHIARRGNCYANLKTIAAICKMSVRQAQYALKDLTDKNLITKKNAKVLPTIIKLRTEVNGKS